MDWTQVDWAVVGAAFLGPVTAVVITLWHQRRMAKKDAQRSIYTAMMRTRRHQISPEFVGAFNLVPVHFHDKKEVMDKYRAVIEIVSNPVWQQGPDESRQRLFENLNSAIAHLLSRISRVVGLPIEQLDILNAAYAPQGWADEEQAQKALRQALFDLLSGGRPLPVVISETEPKPLPEYASLVEAFTRTAPNK